MKLMRVATRATVTRWCGRGCNSAFARGREGWSPDATCQQRDYVQGTLPSMQAPGALPHENFVSPSHPHLQHINKMVCEEPRSSFATFAGFSLRPPMDRVSALAMFSLGPMLRDPSRVIPSYPHRPNPRGSGFEGRKQIIRPPSHLEQRHLA